MKEGKETGQSPMSRAQEPRRLIVGFSNTVPDALHALAERQGKSPEDIATDIAALNQPGQQVFVVSP